nr:hypothetical protein [Tanacetum cinerariifolium]
MVAFLEKSKGSEGFHQILDFLNSTHIKYAPTANLIIYVSPIHQFWETASTSTLEDEKMKITSTIDGKIKTITEASIRSHLKLEDSDGIRVYPTLKFLSNLLLWDQEEPTKLVKDLDSGENGEKEISTVILEVSTAAKNLMYIRRSAKKRKDKGKAIIEEDKSVQKKSKKKLEQERLRHEEAIRFTRTIF